jgi:hypothetical protein
MANMSYCRFENTGRDLDDCHHALEDLLVDGEGELSRSELDAAVGLIETALEIVLLVAEVAGLGADEAEDLDAKRIRQVLQRACQIERSVER